MGIMKSKKLSMVFATLILSLMMSFSVAQMAFADVASYSTTGGVDYTGVEFSFENEVFDWDYENLTLTLFDDVELLLSDASYTLALPAGTTLVLNGDLFIENATYGIYSEGDLTITGDGGLYIENANYGVYSEGDLTITCDGYVIVDYVNYGIYSKGDLTVVGNGADATDCYLYFTEVYYNSCFAHGTMTMDDVNCISQYVNCTLEAAEIYITDSSLYLSLYDFGDSTQWAFWADGYVSIKNSNVVSQGIAYCGVIDIENSVVSTTYYVLGTELNVTDSDLTGVFSVETFADGDYTYVDTFYGVATQDPESFYNGDLYFAPGSVLTLVAGLTYDWSRYVIHPENMNIIDEGATLILPEGVTLEGLIAAAGTETATEDVVVEDVVEEVVAEVEVATDGVFVDVVEGSWFYKDIMTVYEKGWIGGTSETEFEPNATTSRAMVTTILYRMSGEVATGEIPFGDVAAGTWYTDGVIWAAANGIVSGVGENEFAPNDSITREQMAVILYNYASYLGMDVTVEGAMGMAGYADVGEISDWAYSAMTWAVLNGIITGDGDQLNPTDGATRAELAVVLNRFADM